MPLPPWLPVWLTSLLGAGWVRGLLGIRKDLVDAKKAKLEVRKLEHEERTRTSPIAPASFDDVKRYDAKRRAVMAAARREEGRGVDFLAGRIRRESPAAAARAERRRRERRRRILVLAVGLLIGLLVIALSVWRR